MNSLIILTQFLIFHWRFHRFKLLFNLTLSLLNNVLCSFESFFTNAEFFIFISACSKKASFNQVFLIFDLIISFDFLVENYLFRIIYFSKMATRIDTFRPRIESPCVFLRASLWRVLRSRNSLVFRSLEPPLINC